MIALGARGDDARRRVRRGARGVLRRERVDRPALCAWRPGCWWPSLLALCTLRFRADQVVVGIAINLLVVGVTRFFLRLAFDSAVELAARAPGSAARRQAWAMLALLANPLVWLGLLALPALAWLLWRTPFGLRVRAVGEKPEAAATLGVPVAQRCGCAACALRGARVARRCVSRARPAPVHRQHDGGARLHRARGDHLRAVDAAARGGGLPALRGGGNAADPTAGCATHPVAVRGDDPVRADDRGAGRRGGRVHAAGSPREARSEHASPTRRTSTNPSRTPPAS